MEFFQGLLMVIGVCALTRMGFIALCWFIDWTGKKTPPDEPDIGGWIDRLKS